MYSCRVSLDALFKCAVLKDFTESNSTYIETYYINMLRKTNKQTNQLIFFLTVLLDCCPFQTHLQLHQYNDRRSYRLLFREQPKITVRATVNQLSCLDSSARTQVSAKINVSHLFKLTWQHVAARDFCEGSRQTPVVNCTTGGLFKCVTYSIYIINGHWRSPRWNSVHSAALPCRFKVKRPLSQGNRLSDK